MVYAVFYADKKLKTIFKTINQQFMAFENQNAKVLEARV